jgi:hypothetical protein
MWVAISYKQGDVVYRGGGEEQAVYAVEDAPVTGEEMTEILDVEDALEHRLEEIPALGKDRDACPDDGRFSEGEVQDLVRDEPDDEDRQEQAAQATLDGLVRAEAREEQATSEEVTGEVGAGVGNQGPTTAIRTRISP